MCVSSPDCGSEAERAIPHLPPRSSTSPKWGWRLQHPLRSLPPRLPKKPDFGGQASTTLEGSESHKPLHLWKPPPPV